MRLRPPIFFPFLFLIFAALVQPILGGSALQVNEKQAKTKQGAGKSSVWREETTAPVRARSAPAKPSLEYRIYKRGNDGRPVETNVSSTFVQGDKIQFRVKPNQNGYLYIIQGDEAKEGDIIFPHSRLGGVQNFLTKNVEYTIPGECDREYKDSGGACWLPLQSSAGRVLITINFSPTQDAPVAVRPGNKVAREEILNLRKSAGPVSEVGVYGKKAFAAPKSKAIVANLDLNHQVTPVITQKPADPAPIKTAPPPPPRPSDIWLRLDGHYENLQANGLRLALYKRSRDGGREMVDLGRTTFSGGDKIRLEFHSNFKGFVYVVDVSPTGNAELLFPTKRDGEVQANYRYIAPAGGWLEIGAEKGIHVLQVIMAGDRIPQFEEIIKKQKPQMGKLDIIRPEDPAKVEPVDCRPLASVLLKQRLADWRLHSVQLDSNGYCETSEAIVLISDSLAQGQEDCRPANAAFVRGGLIGKRDVAIFEVRLKQEIAEALR